MEELWEDVRDYEGHYQISSGGKVFSLKSNKELKPNIVRSGYKMVRLHKNGWSRDYLVHRLVADAFCNNYFNKPIVNHKDGNKINNYFLNLEWVTDSENQLHAIRTGLKGVRFGANHPRSKLQDGDIISIRKMYKNGFTLEKISSIFNINISTVGRIIQGISWTHIKE